MKKYLVILLLVVSLFLLVSCTSTQTKIVTKLEEEAEVTFDFDDKYFVGIQEHIYEIRAMEPSLTLEYVSDIVKYMGLKVFRLNVTLYNLFYVDTNDTVKFNQSKKNAMRQVIDGLKAAGVEKIVYSTDTFIYPYAYKTTHEKAVPSPYNERESYIRFLQVNSKAYGMIAQEFPEIEYYELINEPDIPNNECIVKNGLLWGQGGSQFMYSVKDEANICVDLCYYCRQEIRKVNPNNKMMGPALSSLSSTLEYIEEMYLGIESGAHPTGDNLPCSVDPDDYFDILDIHPYINVLANEYPETPKESGVTLCTENYALQCKKFYELCCKHGDSEKPHWYTEVGATDTLDPSKREVIGRETTKQLNMIKEELPFVECVIFYVLSDLNEFHVSITEDNFGLFTSPLNEDEPMMMKPIAKAIYTYVNNGSTDYSGFEELRSKYLK